LRTATSGGVASGVQRYVVGQIGLNNAGGKIPSACLETYCTAVVWMEHDALVPPENLDGAALSSMGFSVFGVS
jgi:hypothetical protein